MHNSCKSRIFVAKNDFIMRHTLQKAVFGIAALLLSLGAYAQDIIVTTDAKKIEAKITEVTKSEIRYKEKDYTDGPTFVISTDEISSIIYGNGKVVLYTQPSAQEVTQHAQPVTQEVAQPVAPEPEQPVVDESLAEILLVSGQIITAHIATMKSDCITYETDGKQITLSASEIAKVTLLYNGQVRYYSQSPNDKKPASNSSSSEQIDEVANHSHTVYSAYEFQGGTLPKFTCTKVHVSGKKNPKKRYVGGNMVLTGSEFLKFLEMYCPEAYAYQRKANVFLILECCSILFGIIPVAIFAALCISNSSKVLPTYNGSCAGHQVAVIEIDPQHYNHDQVQLATIVP